MRRSALLPLLLVALPLRGATPGQSPADVRAQLESAKAIVAACAAAPSAKTCAAGQIADAVQVALPGGPRTLELDWLRGALADAAIGKDKKQAADELRQAGQRLDREIAELQQPGGIPQDQLHREQETLRAILTSGDFPQPKPPSLLERLRDVLL